MKFSKALVYNSVPEWRQKYINYSGLKKHLKRLQAKYKEDEADKRRTDVENGERQPLLEPHAEDEVQFFKMLDEELNKINDFYLEKETEFVGSIKDLSREFYRPFEHPGEASAKHLKEHMVDLYRELHALSQFSDLNHKGFQKILKKHDKMCGGHTREHFLSTLNQQPFLRSTMVEDLLKELEELYGRLFVSNDLEKAADELKSNLAHVMTWTRNTVWRDMIARERKKQAVVAVDVKFRPVKAIPFAMSVFVAVVIIFLPILQSPEQWAAHKCLAILVFVSMLWATEALPLYVTSIIIPVLVTVLGVLLLPDSTDIMPVRDAAKFILGRMMDPVIMLVLGGFTMASALSKYDLDKRLAVFVLSKAGSHPMLILFTIMLMAVFLSMWISNVAAPVLCVSLVQPIMKDLPKNSPYIKALLLGIAFASNIGGMATPIASPQNAVALQVLQSTGMTISFMEWIMIAMPLCVLLVCVCHSLLYFIYKPKITSVASLHFSGDLLGTNHLIVIGVTLLTIVLWFLGPLTERIFGHMGMVAIIPVVAFFGLGLLPKEDFNNLPWNVLFLVGGGIALGSAVQLSHLLDIVARFLQDHVQAYSLWTVLVIFSGFVTFVSTFISHTAASLIVLPIIAQVGQQMGHPRLLVMSCAFMCSGGMGLPISSFPNVNCMNVEDEAGVPYLRVSDFIKSGVLMTLLCYVTIISLGYVLMVLFHF
mmetsp:Transcript_43974/g.71540  ORF Transcript_43974/g.71540 Transcript_43974/m.71540 type:complete len:707 (-) Transcript_43974:196-2316(-)|eukprot:CAMPEP_0184664520 /NCGR_PEP_ID=MMETSP0308-20130426/53268_1 /TAXON_ID=38269 /ORGANISM="Gloeochaete witrockiana, Strain SAG 46.84" /LENGTH=706 /DNA_ID=CAMNT_0027107985 /DNA_START=17 /DNA_END=2137 /DNA_ORIENTATION=+